MKAWALLLFSLLSCTKPVPHDVVPEPVDATVDASVEAAVVIEAGSSAHPAPTPQFPTHAGDDGWVKKLARAPSFTQVNLVGDADAAPSILELAWRVFPPAGDANNPRRFELVLTRGSVSRTIALGEHGGWPARSSLTVCRREEPDAGADARWMIPAITNLVASFSMETMQSGSDFLLVLGRDVLHLLHRDSEDGGCPESIKQGPLSGCQRWALFADIKLRGEPPAKETVSVQLDAASTMAPFVCNP